MSEYVRTASDNGGVHVNSGIPNHAFYLAATAIGGFVRCIAVDPNHSNRALLVFGNYNFPSLWYTTDGGANWTDVEGNIAGVSGPSVRWASMIR